MWIAYKIYYLCDRKQRCTTFAKSWASCELLTKFIIFAIGNNSYIRLYVIVWVVNCLQNLLSLRSETTVIFLQSVQNLLWIAYKIYYLCDRKQHANKIVEYKTCCELLTKFIIFAIGNNCCLLMYLIVPVVNCLQNLLSLRSETTGLIKFNHWAELWIAYKIYYLCDRKQQQY